ncbi:MAG TPA: hypothetical protein VFE06_12110 [Acidobacteriaceae bacterium]|nr:hypothetical protein [Acidobacteriaceae bacterium]
MNNIRQRTAREPIVQVEDENHKPVAGAVVIFLLPNDGAGGTFAGGARTLTVTTDAKGQAVARGFHPNQMSGRFQIRVQASYQGRTAQATINQTNQVGNTSGRNGSSSSALPKWLAILAAGAVTAAVVSVVSRGNTPPAPGSVPVAVIPGTGSVGAPH